MKHNTSFIVKSDSVKNSWIQTEINKRKQLLGINHELNDIRIEIRSAKKVNVTKVNS